MSYVVCNRCDGRFKRSRGEYLEKRCLSCRILNTRKGKYDYTFPSSPLPDIELAVEHLSSFRSLKDPVEYVASKESAISILRKAKEKLDAFDWKVLSLLYLEEMEVSEVMQALSTTRGKILSASNRAFRAIKENKEIRSMYVASF